MGGGGVAPHASGGGASTSSSASTSTSSPTASNAAVGSLEGTVGTKNKKNKTRSAIKTNHRLIKPVTVSHVYRKIMEALVTNLRRTHAMMYTYFYKFNKIEGGNNWITMGQDQQQLNHDYDDDDNNTTGTAGRR